jgi:tubulin epsilon
MLGRFNKLFKRNVYVHHYEQYMDVEDMAAAKLNVQNTMDGYARLNRQTAPDDTEMYTPLGLNLDPVC